MNKYWGMREPQEKLLIMIALGLVCGLFLWQFVLKPVSHFPNSQKQAFEKSLSDLKFMQASEVIFARPQPTPKTDVPPGQLQATITKTAALKNLPIFRRQPNGDDELTVWLEDVISVDIYAWTRALTENYNIVLERVSMTRDDDGTISAQITFSRET